MVDPAEVYSALEETAVESGGVRVSGTLATVDGRPAPDRRVAVTLDGTTIGTVRTGGDGSFASTLDVPGRLRPDAGNASLELVASFDGEGTNLEGSRDSETVEIPAIDAADGNGPGGENSEMFQLSRSQLALLGGLVILVVGGAFAWRRRSGDGVDEPDQVRADAPRDSTPDADQDSTPGQAVPEPTPLDAAAQRLDEGATDAAVETAYAVVRSDLGDALDVSGARTHWEFLRASRAAGLNGDGYAALEALTEGYERAAFAPGSVPADEAAQVVEAARTLDGLS